MSKGLGDVSNTLKGDGNFFENVFADFANYSAQLATGGTVGWEKGQGIEAGAVSKAIISGTKEITGANAAEAANNMARQQFEQTKADAEKARMDAQQNVANSELQKSQLAGAARNASASSRSTTDANAVQTFNLGDDEKDFLGL